MEYLRKTPWDKRNFGIETYELVNATEEALKVTDNHNGHYTLKVSPLENAELLFKYDFYYTDTLIEPVCKKENLVVFEKEGTSISHNFNQDDINQIAEEAFMHGRFHRDWHIPNELADLRYKNWVNDLQLQDQIFALNYFGQTVGFFAYEGNKVLLLGMKEAYRKKGLAKVFTSQGCSELFKQGHEELRTSISAANVASLNLFYALGFRLKNTIDVYHKLTGPGVT